MNEALTAFFGLSLILILFAGLWKSFEKADIDGWRALIPLYNIYIIVKLAGFSGWMVLGFFIPILNIFIPPYVYYKFAKNFDKGVLLSVLTGLLPYIGVPLIGFGSSNYIGDYKIEEDSLA
jgi:hypothetical protein